MTVPTMEEKASESLRKNNNYVMLPYEKIIMVVQPLYIYTRYKIKLSKTDFYYYIYFDFEPMEKMC